MFRKLKKEFFGPVLAGSYQNGKFHVGRSLNDRNEEHDITISREGCSVNGRPLDIDLCDENILDNMIYDTVGFMQFGWSGTGSVAELELRIGFATGAIFDVYAHGFCYEMLKEALYILSRWLKKAHLQKLDGYTTTTLHCDDMTCHIVSTSTDPTEIVVAGGILEEIMLTDEELVDLCD